MLRVCAGAEGEFEPPPLPFVTTSGISMVFVALLILSAYLQRDRADIRQFFSVIHVVALPRSPHQIV